MLHTSTLENQSVLFLAGYLYETKPLMGNPHSESYSVDSAKGRGSHSIDNEF